MTFHTELRSHVHGPLPQALGFLQIVFGELDDGRSPEPQDILVDGGFYGELLSFGGPEEVDRPIEHPAHPLAGGVLSQKVIEIVETAGGRSVDNRWVGVTHDLFHGELDQGIGDIGGFAPAPQGVTDMSDRFGDRLGSPLNGCQNSVERFGLPQKGLNIFGDAGSSHVGSEITPAERKASRRGIAVDPSLLVELGFAPAAGAVQFAGASDTIGPWGHSSLDGE